MEKRILRPMEYGDLLDETFYLYKKNFLLFAGISAICYLPLNLLIYSFGQKSPVTTLIGFILLYTLNFLVMAATSWAVAVIYLGGTTTIVNSYQATIRRIIPLVFTIIVGYLAVFGGIILLIVPGALMLISLSLMSPIVLIEGKGPIASVKRCWRLSAGQRGRIVITGLITGLIMGIIMMVLTMPVAFIAGFTAGMSGSAAEPMGGAIGALYGLLNGIAQTIATPIQVIALVVLYYDIRVRKEGFDLELLAQSIGEAPAVETPDQEGVKPF